MGNLCYYIFKHKRFFEHIILLNSYLNFSEQSFYYIRSSTGEILSVELIVFIARVLSYDIF